MKKKVIIIIAVSLAVFITTIILFIKIQNKETVEKFPEEKVNEEIFEEDKKTPEGPVYCTQDVMKCPDGSYVGREPPDCNFRKCPTPIFKVE